MPRPSPPNDSAKREASVRKLVGDDLYEEYRDSFDNADAVLEAARFARQLREEAGYSQRVLGEKLGVSQARVSEIERGDSPEGISYALLKRVARACGKPDWPASPVAAAQQEANVVTVRYRWQPKRARPSRIAAAEIVADELLWNNDVWGHTVDIVASNPGTTIQEVLVAAPTSVGPRLFKIDASGTVPTVAVPVPKAK